MKSIGKMIERINGLTGTEDLSIWEEQFVSSVFELYKKNNMSTSLITEKQVDIIERIFNKHFAD